MVELPEPPPSPKGGRRHFHGKFWAGGRIKSCHPLYCLLPLPSLLPGSFFCSTAVLEPGILPLLVPNSFFCSPVLTAPDWPPPHPDFPASFFCGSVLPAPGWLPPQPLPEPAKTRPEPDTRVARHNPARTFLSSLMSMVILHESVCSVRTVLGSSPPCLKDEKAA